MAPVFRGIEAELGAGVCRMLFPDGRASQARAVESVCGDTRRRPLYESLGFRPYRHVRYYRAL